MIIKKQATQHVQRLVIDAQLLQISNNHTAESGNPPDFQVGENYLSYFENAMGDQLIFCGIMSDDDKNEAFLWMGNLGWEDKKCLNWKTNPCPGKLYLTDPEKYWLLGCWLSFMHVDNVKEAAKHFFERIKSTK